MAVAATCELPAHVEKHLKLPRQTNSVLAEVKSEPLFFNNRAQKKFKLSQTGQICEAEKLKVIPLAI